MSLWLPGGHTSNMSSAERAEADATARAYIEMGGYLRVGDVDGADAYMEQFQRDHGQPAHDTVLQMLQTVTASPDWRTFD